MSEIDFLLVPEQSDDVPWLSQVPVGARSGWYAGNVEALLGRLEGMAGLPEAPDGAAERFARWHAAVRADDDGTRSYSRSAEADPVGVSVALLGLRDDLVRWGWRGQALRGTPLVEDLCRLGPHAAPTAIADRARRLLDEGIPSGLRLRCAEPLEHLEPPVRRLASALAASCSAPEAPAADAGTDLRRLQARLLGLGSEPLVGDGTVILIEADTAWEAAEAVSAEPPDGPEGWVIPAEEALLDRARRRHGRPRFGLQPAPDWPVGTLLRLHLRLARRPRDVRAAHALLTLPVGPLPSSTRQALARVLREEPAVWGGAWTEAVERSATRAARQAFEGAPDAVLGAAAAAAAAQEARATVERWFPRPDRPAPDTVDAVRERAASLGRWASERGIDALAQALSELSTLLGGLPGPQAIDEPTLGELVALIRPQPPRLPAEAGHPAWSRRTGACLPVDRVVWWGFVGPAPDEPSPWTVRDRRALSACGVEIPSAAERRRIERWRWLRPALAARRRLILVRWRTSGGVPIPPHPLADELRLERCAVGIAERLALGPCRSLATRAHRPPRATWRLPPRWLGLPDEPLSPTSIEVLLGCPLRFVLRNLADLREGDGQGPMDGARLAGTLAHRALQDLLLGPDGVDPRGAAEEEIASRTASALDARIRALAPELLEPGRASERARLTRRIVAAGRELCLQLRAGGWWATGAEEPVGGRIAGRAFSGRVDLDAARADGRVAVIDIKLGRFSDRRAELGQGRALQLAMYAAGRRERPDRWPDAAYLVVEPARMAASSDRFPEAAVPAGPPLSQTFAWAEEGLRAWEGQLALGVVCARDPELPEPVSAPPGGPENPLTAVEAPCRICEFRAICAVRAAG